MGRASRRSPLTVNKFRNSLTVFDRGRHDNFNCLDRFFCFIFLSDEHFKMNGATKYENPTNAHTLEAEKEIRKESKKKKTIILVLSSIFSLALALLMTITEKRQALELYSIFRELFACARPTGFFVYFLLMLYIFSCSPRRF